MTDNQKIQKIKGILALLREEREKVHAQKMYTMELNNCGWITDRQFEEITAAVQTQLDTLAKTGNALYHLEKIIKSKDSALSLLPEDLQAKVNWETPAPLTDEEKQLILKAQDAYPNEYEAMSLTCLPVKTKTEVQR